MLTKVREEYRGKLNVRIGVELGLQPHLGNAYEKLAGEYPFDFVIGSLHLVQGMDPYYGKVFEGKTDGEVYRQAFRETLHCLEKVSSLTCWGIWITWCDMEEIRHKSILTEHFLMRLMRS